MTLTIINNPMTTKTLTIESELSTLLGQAFTTLDLPADLGEVQRSQRP